MGNEMEIDVGSFLRTSRDMAPQELKTFFTKFEDLHDRKLWHQLTMVLEEFMAIPSSAPYLKPLYETFISTWEKKMNQLKLVQFLTKVASVLPNLGESAQQSLEFLNSKCNNFKEKADTKEAYILCKMESAHYQLMVSELEACKSSMDECGKILEDLPSVDPIINASFYRVGADYYKVKGNYPQFYKSALLFLSSVSLDDLPAAEKVERAKDLAIAAVLGEGVYNFGELLMHPILDTLKETPHGWLRELLFTFNSGDMPTFDKISRSGPFLSIKILVNGLPFLKEKLCLMTLVESVFKRSKEERGSISFSAIAKECRVGENEVEHLVMKALSLDLLKGSIDEITKSVQITWVQPRILDRGQIATIKSKLEEWNDKVKKHILTMETEEGGEVFAH